MTSSFLTPDEITIRTLSQATESLQIKAEVQSVLNSIIQDIETTNDLETKLNHQYELQSLKRRCDNAERALKEYKVMEREKNDKARLLVEDFVQDLGGLTGLVRGLKLERVTLAQSGGLLNEQLQLLQHQRQLLSEEQKAHEVHDNEQDAASTLAAVNASGQNHTMQMNDDAVTPEAVTKPPDDLVDGYAKEEQTEIKPTQPQPQQQQHSNQEIPSTTQTDQQQNDDQPSNEETSATQSQLATIAAVPPPPSSATTTKQTKIIKQKKKIKRRLPPTLQSLNSSTLMKIFEFMDAMDIVNMAQTNVRMYSKVDSIFGLGGAGLETDGRDEDDADFEEVWIEEDVEVEVEVETKVENKGDGQSDQLNNAGVGENDVREHATIVSIPTPSSSGTNLPKPTKVSIPAKATATTANIAAKKTQQNPTIAAPTVKPEPVKEQSTSQQAPVPTPKPPPSNPTSTSTTSSTSDSGGFQISSAVAAALADKLSPKELSVIITMRDQLRIKEQETIKMKEELKSLNATLDGTLSVKEVLTVKVKEQQLAIDQNKEIAAKMNRQTSSDQEVIAFLDERVQELERLVGNFDDERSVIRGEVDSVKKASEKQLAVLGDMLTFEREQMADHEKEWKSTKKVLVKEVKHLRAQILALEAERDGYYVENMKLKEALQSVGSSSKTSKSFEYSS